MGIPERTVDTAVEEIPGRDLVVFPDGPPRAARNHLLHELLPPPATLSPPATAVAWERRKALLLSQIREHVLPDVETAPETTVPRLPHEVREGPGWTEVKLVSGDGTPLRGLMFRPKEAQKKYPGLLYIAAEGENQQSIGRTLTRVRQSSNAVVLIVFPRGVSDRPWDDMFRRTAMRNAIVIGHTTESLRLADALTAARALMNDTQVDRARVTVLGRRAAAGLALYTAILRPEVAQVALLEAPATHKDNPVFLHVLRHTDLAEAAALVLPRRVAFIGGMPEAFRFTKEIAAVTGNLKQVGVTMSIEGLVEGRTGHGFAAGW